MIHTVKGFGIVNKAEIDVFLELSCFFHDPADDLICKAKIQTQTWKTNIWILREKGGGMNWEIGIYIYIYIHIHTKDTTHETDH